MFIVALFTTAKTWKQLKYTSTDEWIKKMWYSAIQKNEIMPFVATWMDLKITILSEVKSDRGKTNTWYHLYVELKYDTNELI